MHHCNKSDLAGIFGVTIPTIDQWVRDGMPVVERSERKGVEWKFETSEAIKWRIDYAIKRDREGRKSSPGRTTVAAPDDDPIRAAQVRKLIAEAEIKEQKAALAKREVVRVADVELALSTAIANSKNKLMGLGSKVAPLVSIETEEMPCREIVDAAVREALEELADVNIDGMFEEDPEVADEDDSGENSTV